MVLWPTGMSAYAHEYTAASEAIHANSTREDPRISHRASTILQIHNAERRLLDLPELRWNTDLEEQARDWARHLSRRGMLRHADYRTLGGTGENLWMGTAGRWSPEAMVSRFIQEKRHYRHGRFPDISRTGNWSDVGHYSQVVWRETREVGCAIATGHGNDVLVCRYWPAGNVMGRPAF